LRERFLAKPEVLILDEPSAALDPARERELVDNLRWAFAGKTLIAITHKPALASVADHILYIKGWTCGGSGVRMTGRGLKIAVIDTA